MEVETASAPSQIYYTNGIEGAGNGFFKGGKALAILAFNGTETTAVLEMAEGALLTARHQGCHQVSVTVYFEEALGLRRRTTLWTHKVLEYGIIGFDGFQFLFLERSTAVPHYAAFALANGIIAGEVLQNDVFRDQDIPYLYNGAEVFPLHGTR
jgi:hypothetical protein